ncbi:MAG: hypothetical protein IPL30_11005 [Elusimicrobia bacterium]|nr:hypothetical protein [Elusimicrobiota bacterium]
MNDRELLNETYSDDVADLWRDVDEAINDSELPKDSDGFFMGKIVVLIKWIPIAVYEERVRRGEDGVS